MHADTRVEADIRVFCEGDKAEAYPSTLLGVSSAVGMRSGGVVTPALGQRSPPQTRTGGTGGEGGRGLGDSPSVWGGDAGGQVAVGSGEVKQFLRTAGEQDFFSTARAIDAHKLPTSVQDFIGGYQKLIEDILAKPPASSSSTIASSKLTTGIRPGHGGGTMDIPLPSSIAHPSVLGDPIGLRLPFATVGAAGTGSMGQRQSLLRGGRERTDPKSLFKEDLTGLLHPNAQRYTQPTASTEGRGGESGGGWAQSAGGFPPARQYMQEDDVGFAQSQGYTPRTPHQGLPSYPAQPGTAPYTMRVDEFGDYTGDLGGVNQSIYDERGGLVVGGHSEYLEGEAAFGQSTDYVGPGSSGEGLEGGYIRGESGVGAEYGMQEESDLGGFGSMPLLSLKKLAGQFHHSSLRQMSQRKLRQLQSRGIGGFEKGLETFRASEILVGDEAEMLYFTMPFLTKPPTLSLIYSTFRHKRELSELYRKALQVSNLRPY